VPSIGSLSAGYLGDALDWEAQSGMDDCTVVTMVNTGFP
jgi:hypothetical protein